MRPPKRWDGPFLRLDGTSRRFENVKETSQHFGNDGSPSPAAAYTRPDGSARTFLLPLAEGAEEVKLAAKSQSVATAFAVLSCIAFAIALGCLLIFYRQHGVSLTIFLFFTSLPFILGIIWFVHLYLQSRSAFARAIVSALSTFGIIFLPASFYYASKYSDDSAERRILVILAAIDTLPFVLGLMWFLFLIAKPKRNFK